MCVDKHGKPLFHGAYVHFKHDPFNGNKFPDASFDEIDGWLLFSELDDSIPVVELYTTMNRPDQCSDSHNHLVFTGIYWELDDDPLWEIELD